MKKSRFTETQIVSILKQSDVGMKLKDLCREHGISEATCYHWKSKYGGMEAPDVRRMKELETENTKLKRRYADLAWENRAMKDLIKKTLTMAEKRTAVDNLREAHGLPVKRGCGCVGLSRAASSAPPLDRTMRDAEVIAALNALVEAHPPGGSGSLSSGCATRENVGTRSGGTAGIAAWG